MWELNIFTINSECGQDIEEKKTFHAECKKKKKKKDQKKKMMKRDKQSMSTDLYTPL